MPRVKKTMPSESREKGQRSLDMYLPRFVPPFRQPDWLTSDMWRNIVARQPFAMVCRETLISQLTSLEWKVEPRDSTQRDELKGEIKYYSKLFEYGGHYDYVSLLEWICKDLMDLPFGGAVEVGREGDDPNGKVEWIIPLDAGTLFPTLNFDYPVGQYVPYNTTEMVFFPKHAINRVLYSPRTDIKREGWGLAPPEKIYLAIELLNRGDVYYANLLIDTPQIGILDLMNISKDSAEEWVKSWREMLVGIDPFKIPVLYEHDKEAKFISFTRPPTELMFDKTILKYAALVASCYGMSLSDIGMQVASSGGETLAGSIRQERRTRKTGFARLKYKIKLFFDRMLPEDLEFKFIDLDDEYSVALGRARLASATAFSQLMQESVFTNDEVRQQMIADGLINISIPEKAPERVIPQNDPNNFGKPERPSLLGKPISPSQGGYGEVKAELLSKAYDLAMLDDKNFRNLVVEMEDGFDELEDDEKKERVFSLQKYLNDNVLDKILLDD